MKKLCIASFLIVAIGFMMIGCKKKDSPITKITPIDLDSIAANYYEQYLKLHPLEATAQGDNRYNDQLPISIDKAFITEEIAFYKTIGDQLSKVDYKNLSEEKKVVYNVLDFTLKDRIENYAHNPELIPFTQFGGLPLELPLYGSGDGLQPFKTEKDYQDWLKRLEKFPDWMKQAKENFRQGITSGVVLPKKLVIKMIPQMRSEEITSQDMDTNIFYGPIRTMPSKFSTETKEKLASQYKTIILQKIIPAYTQMGDFLEKEYYPKAQNADGINALPGGNSKYEYLAKTNTTTKLTPTDINRIGLEQVNNLRFEMDKVKKEVGFEGSLEQFIKHVTSDEKAMPYKTSQEVLDAFNGILKKINPGLKTMFTITPRTPFEIRQTEKFREATASAEYYAGSADGKRPGIFYIPLPDPTKFNVTSGMESLFLHEAIPGHHYQVSLQQENTSLPKFMRFGGFNAYQEGWAHYTETLGPELGLYTDPYQRMGYLSDQMLRAVRLVVDTGIHTGRMTREEAISYFLSNIAYSEEAAVAEIERYMAIPGQALGYKIGALKIRELREKYEQKLGKKFSLAKYHDEVLNQGCLPLDVLERKIDVWASKQ